jgi:hypothetical protein
MENYDPNQGEIKRGRGRPPKDPAMYAAQQAMHNQQTGGMPSIHTNSMVRRSRYEEEGRDFACTLCDKSYLSKPGLYLHVK